MALSPEQARMGRLAPVAAASMAALPASSIWLIALATLYVVDLGREDVVFGLSDADAVLRSRLFASPLSVGLMGLASATVGGATGTRCARRARLALPCWTRLLSTTGDDMLDR